MKKKIILRSLIILGIFFIVYESYSIVSMITNPNLEVLENVRTIDLKKDKSIAIMVQEEGTTFKEATDRSKWPDINTYVYDKAECVDSEGTPIDYKTVLTFNYDQKTATLKTKQTLYCTLYFVKGKASLQLLQTQGGDTFKLQSGMYRFVGTISEVTHNYICFGTTDKTKCLGDPSEFMYRIIGLTSEADDTLGLHANQLKIIKAKPSSRSEQWYSTYSGGFAWEDSGPNTYLNGTNSDQFLGSVKWESPAYWKGLITSQKWYNADQKEEPGATAEPTSSQTSNSYQVGLIYATDYMNASSANTSNWLFIANGWTGIVGYYEWTMSRYGLYGSTNDNYYAWFVDENGSLKAQSGNLGWSVRAVFYLQPGVTLFGEGSTTDPFRIAG